VEVDLDLIGDICMSYSDSDLYKVYLGGDIPDKIMVNAEDEFPLTNMEYVYMIYDSSTFGNGKTGIAICDNGVFYKNDKLNKPCYKHFSWEEFSTVDIYLEGSKIFFGNEYYVYLPTVIETREAIEELLITIQQSLFGKVWDISFGPLNNTEIQKMILQKIFDPQTVFARKKGTDEWELFNDIPELKALVDGLTNNTIQQPQISASTKTKEFGASKKVDINTCKADDLLSIDCMDMQRINCLMEKRESGKKFYTVEEVAELLELKSHEVEELKDKLEFNSSKILNGVRRIEF